MKYTVGDKARVVGRDEWHEGGWDLHRAIIGKVGIIHECYGSSVQLNINGKMWGLVFESIVPCAKIGEQLLFSFMEV
ncbi:MAG: hypothetical protein IMZ70_08370 [Candidatus Atribacteria bacterium]|nr:hypothetical protein [Candidatus Atribacteria bacterium]